MACNSKGHMRVMTLDSVYALGNISLEVIKTYKATVDSFIFVGTNFCGY